MKERVLIGHIGGILPGVGASPVLAMLIGIMVFLTALALAGAFALASGTQGLQRALSHTLTVQIVHADPEVRATEAAAAVRAVRALPGVERVEQLDRQAIADILEPWLGSVAHEADLPLPALIDVSFNKTQSGREQQVTAVLNKIAPHARVDAQSRWLQPLAGLLDTMRWLAFLVVFLVALALLGTVVLATRAALNTHSETISVMHMMGATDAQISRLFERRVGLDGIMGGAVALICATLLLFYAGRRIAAVDSALFNAAEISPVAWGFLWLLPLAAALLSALTARFAVFRSLRETL